MHVDVDRERDMIMNLIMRSVGVRECSNERIANENMGFGKLS